MYNILRLFFPVLSKGVTNNFPSETPWNRPKNTNFLNIHQINNWDYEPLCKNKWLRRWWQNFWVSTSFATFLIEKIMILNMAIWVIKRSVLARQIQWCMRKIIKKSKKIFWFNDVKLPEKFICDIQFVEKCSIRGVLTKFCV